MKRVLPALLTSLLLAALAVAPARAGAQHEEALSDAVRLALSTEVADALQPTPDFGDPRQLVDYLLWLATESARLSSRIPDRVVRENLLRRVWYESRRAGLEPALVLGLIQVESGFRSFAVSNAGALGLMQVMPFWTRQIGDGDPRTLFSAPVNLRYGCVILRHYLDEEHGNLFMALGRYNGSRGRAAYPDAVLAARRAWLVAAPATMPEPAPVQPGAARVAGR